MSSTAVGPLVSDKTSWQATRPLYYSCIVCIVVDTVIVAAKTYSRVRVAKLPFWWDDFWIIMGYILLIPICAMGITMVKVEVAWNDEDRIIMNPDENEILLKIIYALLQFLVASYASTRYSILALYLRIFSGRRLRIAVWCVIGFVTIQWMSFAIAAVFQCIPVAYFWDRTMENGKCFDIDTFYRAVTPFNLLVDIILIFMPLPTVWQLKATATRKWALTLLFGIGIAALVASSVRFVVYDTHTAEYIAPSYTNIMIMWLVIEPSIYLIVACLPAMHHIVAAAVPRQISNWISERMERLTLIQSSRGRSKTGGATSPTSDSRGLTCTDEHDLCIELGTTTTSQIEAKHGVGSSILNDDPWLQANGILVTKEVTLTVTQEQRIEQVLGF
ncbi:hypothetical protein VM1G_00601 [Cytospora mali]|uniref:Rhodopsin domain-containing protein n=1 Tax=Cytospora mali TaxID=578113 RepID=A0A194VMX0_CYTMA|nr:hypothetical protein VM1G_00601 [Valsa mali]